MINEPSVLVPNLDEGEKIVAACNKEFMLDGTAKYTMINSDGVTLPSEFSNKLDFDVNQRKQFEGHPLACHAAGGLEGFGKRLTRVYTSMVALKVAQGYEGSLMGLWNQDTVYILGELLCYTDDVMSVRLMLAFEEAFLSEAVIEDNVAYLTKQMELKCPRFVNKLKSDDSLSPTMFGIYRSFCTTLLCKAFGGRPILPRLWRECVKMHSLKPLIVFLVLVFERSEGGVIANYDSGRGVADLNGILKQAYSTLPEGTVEDMFIEVKQLAAGADSNPKHGSHHGSYLGSWMVLNSTIAHIIKCFYPLAYGRIPPWALEHGPTPHSLPARIVLTTAIWLLVFTILALVFSPAKSDTVSYAFPAIISTVVVFVPILPITAIYHGQTEGFQPLGTQAPGNLV
eukprot:TRINITY_DN3967_c2_g1_i1.p1 TRINITY_DN3967_c2_g1~~TRINITY_DN3967_c2_g1_i1.p1  ORF type:complete len:418 (+),score=100.78 TRINITY_DN3967_c2_g1_i1:61-1254(+)